MLILLSETMTTLQFAIQSSHLKLRVDLALQQDLRVELKFPKKWQNPGHVQFVARKVIIGLSVPFGKKAKIHIMRHCYVSKFD